MNMMDMSQYLDVFLEESKEHLSNLNQKLLALEKNPEELSALDEIFRAAHTLKGMSSTMGFEDLADLTHHMENVLSDLKDRIIKVDTGVVDVLFKCFDRLQTMIECIQNGQSSAMDNSDLIGSLENIKGGKHHAQTPAAKAEPAVPEKPAETAKLVAAASKEGTVPIRFNEYDHTVFKEALERGYKVIYAKVHIDKNCLMKSVRVFMVFKALEEDGEIIKTDPPAQELDEGKFDEFFELIITTMNDVEEINRKINGISEVSAETVRSLSASDLTDIMEAKIEERKVQPDLEEKAAAQSAGLAKKDRPSAGRGEAQVDDGAKAHKVKQTVRVDIERLDSLMNLVGELVINKGRLEQIGVSKRLPELNEAVEQMERVTNDLQNVVMKVRMVPIESVFNRFPRMVRDLAKDLGKEVEFVIEGKDTELDRTVIDEIGDPLVHLLRNSLDHGLEDPDTRERLGKNRIGLVRLSARHEGNNVFIEVEDDGGGINVDRVKAKAIEKELISAKEADTLSDAECIQFLFKSGFSTAINITDVSGRGVGLDVVRSKIESLNGEIVVDSRSGEGTTFRVRLPLTLAIIQALLVKVGKESYAIPLTSVDETTLITPDEIKLVQGQEVVVLRGVVLPMVRLHDVLQVPDTGTEPEEMYMVVVKRGSKQMGLVVDSLIGQQEIVIKSLGKLLAGIPGIAGATILGDGDVSLIIDVGTLI